MLLAVHQRLHRLRTGDGDAHVVRLPADHRGGADGHGDLGDRHVRRPPVRHDAAARTGEVRLDVPGGGDGSCDRAGPLGLHLDGHLLGRLGDGAPADGRCVGGRGVVRVDDRPVGRLRAGRHRDADHHGEGRQHSDDERGKLAHRFCLSGFYAWKQSLLRIIFNHFLIFYATLTPNQNFNSVFLERFS